MCEIMDVENDVVKETRKLDSEMQTLVSENYNKFISATDTIRKMRSDFKKMEEEMEHLVVGMGEITEFNDKVNLTFKDRREEITRLNNVDNLLKKLQFLFDLPSKLNEFIIEQESYDLAVKYYCKARKTLDHYKQMPTFRSIEDECTTIINNLKLKLYEKLDAPDSSQETVSEAVDLLFKLGEPMEQLCSKYIARAERSFEDDLAILTLNIDLLTSSSNERLSDDLKQQAMDILEFVDYGCNYFLANLSAVIQAFNSTFVGRDENTKSFDPEIANDKLNNLIEIYWLKYCNIVRRRFEVEVIELIAQRCVITFKSAITYYGYSYFEKY